MVILFVEGTADDTNGDLRNGFATLLGKTLKGRMPRIVMGDSREQTIKKFQNEKRTTKKFLLIDLDAPKEKRTEVLYELKLQDAEANTFFMIQETEAWFLSQPQLLDEFFGEAISTKIPDRDSQDISKPNKELQKWTRQSPKGKYHKVRHAVELLKKLDAEKLRNDFPDVNQLILTLTHANANL
jgi:hypothetical protein